MTTKALESLKRSVERDIKNERITEEMGQVRIQMAQAIGHYHLLVASTFVFSIMALFFKTPMWLNILLAIYSAIIIVRFLKITGPFSKEMKELRKQAVLDGRLSSKFSKRR